MTIRERFLATLNFEPVAPPKWEFGYWGGTINNWYAQGLPRKLNRAAHYADRIALMVAGNIKAMGKPKEVLQPELIAEAYCLPVQVVPHPFLDVPLVLPETK